MNALVTNMCVFIKMAYRSINITARVLNHISLERASHRHSDKYIIKVTFYVNIITYWSVSFLI